MIHWLQSVLGMLQHGNNQFASGGLLLMVIGAIGATLRKVPGQLYRWLHHQFTISLVITDDSCGLYWFKWWLTEQKYGKRARHVDLFAPQHERFWHFTISPGNHWFWFKRQPLFFQFKRNDEKKERWVPRTESLVITTFGRNQNKLRELISEMYRVYKTKCLNKAKLSVYKYRDGWRDVDTYEPRALESVILPKDHKEFLINDIKLFDDSEQWYESVGIPYHRGYLLHGLPGTGKTSLVIGLSNYFNRPIYYLKLSSMDDDDLRNALADVSPKSLLLIEDVDCCMPNNRGEVTLLPDKENEVAQTQATSKNPVSREEKELPRIRVTLSGLLNALDGLDAPNGVLYFLTTNFVDRLDPALVRPGRIDKKFEFTYATIDQLMEMYNRFFPGDGKEKCTDYVLSHSKMAVTMAEFQEHLMTERNDRINDAEYSNREETKRKADADFDSGTTGYGSHKDGASGSRGLVKSRRG